MKGENQVLLQADDINSCARWATEWQLPFNVSKCKVLHLGLSNPMFSYTMDGTLLDEVSEEKNLGVIIDKDLKFHSHTALVFNKANRLLGLLKHCFVNLSSTTFVNLYKVIIRPVLECNNTIWGPFYATDINNVENIQRKLLNQFLLFII